jgi:hypothetical protein
MSLESVLGSGLTTACNGRRCAPPLMLNVRRLSTAPLRRLQVKRGDQLRKIAVVFIALVSWPWAASSQGGDARFVGTWVLDRIESQSESGDWTPAKTRWGSHPIGILTYDATGNMAVQIMRRDRTPLSSRGLAEGQSVTAEALALAPAEEKAAAFDGYTAYFGKYSVREAEGVVVHQRIGHLVPNQATSSVERLFEFLDDALALAVPGGIRLVWNRAH